MRWRNGSIQPDHQWWCELLRMGFRQRCWFQLDRSRRSKPYLCYARHIYDRYTASVQSAAGCADTAYVDIVVLPSPTAAFTLDNIAACNILTVNCTNTTNGALQHFWDFGDGTTSTLFTPVPHTYATPGAYTITLTATNALQCSDVTTRTVNVFEPPLVQIGAQNVCEGETASFTDLSTFEVGNEISTWSWDFGDGTTSADEAPFHLYSGSVPIW